MTNFEFGDVVLVPFPFTSQTTSKVRPSVIVNSSDYSRHRPDIVVMAVTSQFPSHLGFGEVLVTEWQAAGLIKPSVIKPVFATFEQRIVLRKLGALTTTDKGALRATIAALLR